MPFRGAYVVTQDEQVNQGKGSGGDRSGSFALRRRDKPIPASQVPGDGWEADALKIGCQDFIASMETDIAEQFYLMVEGRESTLKENKTLAATMQAAGKPLFERLCKSRCAKPKSATNKRSKKKTNNKSKKVGTNKKGEL